MVIGNRRRKIATHKNDDLRYLPRFSKVVTTIITNLLEATSPFKVSFKNNKRGFSMNTILNTSDNSFSNDVLKSELPVLVDFWATWCGPCRMLSPIVDKVAENFVNKVNFVKVNVDECPETANEYNIRSIPTLLIFKAGKVVATQIGALSETQLKEFIEKNI